MGWRGTLIMHDEDVPSYEIFMYQYMGPSTSLSKSHTSPSTSTPEFPQPLSGIGGETRRGPASYCHCRGHSLTITPTLAPCKLPLPFLRPALFSVTCLVHAPIPFSTCPASFGCHP